MSNFIKCSNGHYYNPLVNHECPYCCRKSGSMRFKPGVVQTPLHDNANCLRNEENAIIAFDIAPDGIKRYIEVTRRYDDTELIRKIASTIGCDVKDLPLELHIKSEDIEALVKKEFMKKNIFSLDKEQLLSGDYYVSNYPIDSVVPNTLLSQILGTRSKLDLLYESDFQGCNNVNQSVGAQTGVVASMGDEDFQEVRKEVESKKYLSISLDDNSKKVLSIPDRTDVLEITSVNEYYNEDISLFKPKVTFAMHYDSYEVNNHDINTKEYLSKMLKYANHEYYSFRYSISRQNVAKTLLSLFEKVAALHKLGKAHCDLKPQNVLCLKDGLIPIDGINVSFGDLSAGMTANYCAPEQVLAQPVSPATDIYNLGLMILSLIDGVLYGETSTYIIPSGGNKVKKVRLLNESMVYIDSELSNIEKKEGIAHWKTFLEKCLAFNPLDRFADMDIFSKEYKRLLNVYPLANHIEFVPCFGTLSLTTYNGKSEVAWFIRAE